MSTLKILISSSGLSNLSVLTCSIFVQTSIPFVTLPKTVCLLSNQGVGTVVIKTNDGDRNIRNNVCWFQYNHVTLKTYTVNHLYWVLLIEESNANV